MGSATRPAQLKVDAQGQRMGPPAQRLLWRRAESKKDAPRTRRRFKKLWI